MLAWLPIAAGASAVAAVAVWIIGGVLPLTVFVSTMIVAAVFTAVLGIAAFQTWCRPPSLRAAAARLDASAGTESALASALDFSTNSSVNQDAAGPFERLALRRAEACANREDLRLPAPGSVGAFQFWPVALLAAAVCWAVFMPSPGFKGEPAGASMQTAIDPVPLAEAQRAIAETQSEIADLPVETDAMRERIEAIEQLEAELESGLRDPQETVAKVAEELQLAADEAQQEAERTRDERDALAEQLAEIDTENLGAAQELAEALSSGDFERAAQEAERLEQLAENAAVREDLQRLADQLDRAADPAPETDQQLSSAETPEGPETQTETQREAPPTPETQQQLRDLAESIRDRADPDRQREPPPQQSDEPQPDNQEQPTDPQRDPGQNQEQDANTQPQPQPSADPQSDQNEQRNEEPTEQPQQPGDTSQQQEQPSESQSQQQDQQDNQQQSQQGESPQQNAEPQPSDQTEQANEQPGDQQPQERPQSGTPEAGEQPPDQQQPDTEQPQQDESQRPSEAGASEEQQPRDPTAQDRPVEPQPNQPQPDQPQQTDPQPGTPRPGDAPPDPGQTGTPSEGQPQPGDDPQPMPGQPDPNAPAQPSPGVSDAIDRLAERDAQAREFDRAAERYRQMSRDLLDPDAPRERPEVTALNTAPLQPWDGASEIVDARSESARDDTSERVIAEWFEDPSGRAVEPGQPSETARRSITRAREAADRAIEQQTIPRRHEDLVRRVFRRYADRVAPARDAPSPGVPRDSRDAP